MPKTKGDLRAQFTNRVRARIEGSKVIDRLIGFVEGAIDAETDKPIEMSPAQVTAAISLMDRVLPKLSAQTLKVEDRRRPVRELSTEDLMREWDEIRAQRGLTSTVN